MRKRDSSVFNLEKVLKTYKDIKIRFSEVDPLGILWHGNYVQFFEDGREDFGEKYNLTYNDFKNYGHFIPVTRLECKYTGYVKYGEILEMETTYHYNKLPILYFTYIVRRKYNSVIVCTGMSEHVIINSKTYKLVFYKPKFLKEWESNNLRQLK